LDIFRIQFQFPLEKIIIIIKETLIINRNSIFQDFSYVKQLVVLVRLMGYIQLNGHVWGDNKLGYFHDFVSSVLLKFSHQ